MCAVAHPRRVDSGTPGLDNVLHGGFIPGQTAIVSGGPGTGKTVLALQFLTESDDNGLYIGFEEREQDIRRNAKTLGIDLSNVSILDLSAEGDLFFTDDAYSIFPHEEVEGVALLQQIAETIDEEEPDRLVVDPLSELRSMLPDEFQFRRKISSLTNELKSREITTLCTTQAITNRPKSDIQFLGDATIELPHPGQHRTLEVTKFRGSEFAEGEHTYRIRSGSGGRVYPKLVPGNFYKESSRTQFTSGIDTLDGILGGGIESGSVTVISGPSGVGKTTVGTRFLQHAAANGQRAIGYLFEELRSDYLYRASQLGMEVERLAESSALEVEEVESLTRSADEFASHVRKAVEDRDADLVMIDGTAGYRLGLRGERTQDELIRELHALCRYLKRMGVTVILIEEATSITGEFTATSEHISYLADNIVFLRYLETGGEIRKSIGVLKKRFSGFERSLREFSIDEDGIDIGGALTQYEGVLTGTPDRTGDES